MKKKEIIAKLNDESTDIFDSNIIDNYYPSRPQCLAKLNLHDFVSFYDYSKKPCLTNDNHTDCVQLLNNHGYLDKRSQPKLIKVPYYKLLEKKYREKYFHQILMLFKPWFNEDDLLNSKTSYEEAFKFEIHNNTIDSNLITTFETQKKRVQDAIEYAKKLEEFHSDCSETSSGNDSDNDNTLIPDNNNILIEMPCLNVDEKAINEKILQLNKQQKNVFDKIVNRIEHQELHSKNECQCKNKSIKIFCSGVAGSIEFS